MRKIILLRSSFSQALGVMFRRKLGKKIFVFVYPKKARRIFHSFFCPPIRILALDRNAETSILFEKVVPPWRFVALPPTDLVLEMGLNKKPDKDLLAEIHTVVRGIQHREIGGIDANTGIRDLLFALFSAALADLRRVRAVCGIGGYGQVNPEIVQKRFSPWERGKILASAGFILDCSLAARITVPEGAIHLSEQMLEVEATFQDELLAAALAGTPWRKTFPNACLRCGKNASWRFVLSREGIPPELSWRLLRPENAVPLCRNCTRKLHFAKDEKVRRQLVWGLWGPRFEALESWFWAVQGKGVYRLPRNWNKENDPLWPEAFGGREWKTGSGSLPNCDPREPKGIRRTQAQKKTLARILGCTPRLP